MSESETSDRHLLRHTLATLAYRAEKVLRGVPPGFAELSVGTGIRTPLGILAHVGDLFDWAVALFGGEHVWNDASPEDWDEEVERFFDGIQRLDDLLASDQAMGFPASKIFQGPIADAFTHIGQLALLRRRAGAPVRGENYFKADIEVGRIGREQAEPRFEFD